MKMDNNKIIIFFVALFLLSAIYLSYAEQKQADPNAGKNWWALSFVEPKSNSLSFTIENHSDKNNFHWQVLEEKNILDEGDISINKGDQTDIVVPTENISNKKIIIQVSDGKDKKDIYKGF
ncbi:MAG TPA: hypothetical protein VF390_00545 [Patescibacteria group bacterium]